MDKKISGWFSLEVVYAGKGDALILHYGSTEQPRWMLIDGGHRNVYDQYLRPRLEQLALSNPRQVDERGRLPLELVMVSHADEDHLMGILDLTANMRGDLKSRIDRRNVPQAPVTVAGLWFNGFSDIIAQSVPAGTAEDVKKKVVDSFVQTASAGDNSLPAELRQDPDVSAVIASTAQGRQLLNDAALLDIAVNDGFDDGLVMRTDGFYFEFDGELSFRVLGPDKERIDKLRNKWRTDIQKILEKEAEKERKAAEIASFRDASVFNLSSITVLAECHGNTMLLTGDARGDDLIAGLEAEQLLDANGRIEVDLFKLPHHGSNRNVKKETFRDILAKHYVISANGEHGNPDPETLDMLVEGRKAAGVDEPFSVYLSFPEKAYKRIPGKEAKKSKKLGKQRAALKAIDKWLEKKPDKMTIVYREANRLSLSIDFEDKVFS